MTRSAFNVVPVDFSLLYTVTRRGMWSVPLFPVWVGFVAGLYVYLPWPTCKAAKAHRHVTDTQAGTSRTDHLPRLTVLLYAIKTGN